MNDDPATEHIRTLSRDRLVREALRANKALMEYGQHKPDCPQRDAGPGPCDCGLDAACFSPFLVEEGGG